MAHRKMSTAVYELGEAVPRGSTHSVVVSLPTLDSCIGYEEGDPEVVSRVRHGYPRFVVHAAVERATAIAAERLGAPTEAALYAVCSERVVHELARYVDANGRVVEEGRLRRHHVGRELGLAHADWWLIVAELTPAEQTDARAFLQHTGGRISSRQAVAFIEGLESAADVDAARRVRLAVADAAGADVSDVVLCRAGMAAFHAVFKAVNEVMMPAGRHVWLRVGWLYVDTAMVLDRFAGRPERATGFDSTPATSSVVADASAAVERVANATDLDAIREVFARRGHELAGVVAEVPTNPQVQCADLEAIANLCREHGVALVVDPTMASLFAVDVVSRCDLVATSLTKYFGANAGVMAGACIRNPASPIASRVWARVEAQAEPPFASDLDVLAVQCDGAREVFERSSRACARVAKYLESRTDAIARVLWALQPSSADAFRRLSRTPSDALGGAVVSVIVAGGVEAMRRFYDQLECAKGPSFGTTFTLACPFLYLAHYDLVSTPEGHTVLAEAGLDPALVRISVGLEPVEEILAMIERALPPRPAGFQPATEF